MTDIFQDLKRDEGFEEEAYRDTVGKLTIGYGWNIDDRPISKVVMAKRSLSATMTGNATLQRALTARRTLSATMIGRAKAFAKMSFDVLDRISSGGGTVIRGLFILDD